MEDRGNLTVGVEGPNAIFISNRDLIQYSGFSLLNMSSTFQDVGATILNSGN